MTEQKTERKTLAAALRDIYPDDSAMRGNTGRALATWGVPRDEQMERLIEARRRDPAAYAQLDLSTRNQVALYVAAREAQARAFKWRSDLELALTQREDATFTPELERELDIYAEARKNAEEHGLLDEARKRAEGTKR